MGVPCRPLSSTPPPVLRLLTYTFTCPPPSYPPPLQAYWPSRALTPDTRTVTFSLAVDATTVPNGALKFWPCSGAAKKLHPHKPVAGSREDAHAIAVEVDEAKCVPPIETLCVKRGDVTIHDEWVVHGSGGNTTNGTRRTYVFAMRTADTVRRERAAGFT